MTDIHQQIAELEAQIAALKEQAAKKGRWKPEVGDMYWTTGGILHYKWGNDAIDTKLYAIGNCFQTEEAAEAAYQRRVEYVAMRDHLNEISGYFVPDWEDDKQEKWSLYYNHQRKVFDTTPCAFVQFGSEQFFPSRETAKKALALGDKLLPLLHGGW